MTNGEKLYIAIRKVLETVELTELQKADVASSGKGSYEPDSLEEALYEAHELLYNEDIAGLIKLLKKLPAPQRAKGAMMAVELTDGTKHTMPLGDYIARYGGQLTRDSSVKKATLKRATDNKEAIEWIKQQ
jgi:hypothetical protein